MVGFFKVLGFVSDMEESVPGGLKFQGKGLVGAFKIPALVKQVFSNARANGEKRHDVFDSTGCSKSHLMGESGFVELLLRPLDVIFGIDIGTSIVYRIYRHSCSKPV